MKGRRPKGSAPFFVFVAVRMAIWPVNPNGPMTVTPESFRNAEAMLIRAGKTCADTLMTIVGFALESIPAESDLAPSDAIHLSIAALSDRLGWDFRAVPDRLIQAQAEMRHDLGIEIGHTCQRPHRGEASEENEDNLDLTLSPMLTKIIRGSAITLIDAGDPRAMAPDKTSIAMTGLISRIATRGGGGVLFRSAISADGRVADMTTVAATIADREPRGCGIVVQTCGSNPITAALICAVLHGAGVLILCDEILELSDTDGEDEAWLDEDEFPSAKATPWRPMTSAGMHLLALLPHINLTVIAPIPKDAKLSPETASNFITAIGPMRRDRSAALAAVQEIADGQLSDAIAERLVDVWDGHAKRARCSLEAVTRLIGQSFPKDRPKRRDREDFKERSGRTLAYSALAEAMTCGIEPHVWSPVTLQPKPLAAVFHRELFISEPDAELLFSERLRDERGIRILLLGPPGTGKSAAASHIASTVLCMPHFDLKAGDVLFHRLGALERAIAAAFQQARERSAVLIVDEAESLVQDRATASPTSAHLITAITNAVLIELDRHDLPVIMATNFGDRIDPAVKRRLDFTFDVKPIPEELEVRALRLLLDLDPPSGFGGFGGDTAISDYAGAKRVLRLQGGGVEAAIAAVGRARDVRLGKHGKATRRIGF